MLLIYVSVRVRVVIVHHLLLLALPALVRPILVAHLLRWIRRRVAIRPPPMIIRLLLLNVLCYEYVPLFLMRYPLLILCIVKLQFQALINNNL